MNEVNTPSDPRAELARLLPLLDKVTDGGYFQRLASGMSIATECCDFLRKHGATLLSSHGVGGEAVAFRYLAPLSGTTYARTRWMGMDEFQHYDEQGNLTPGPHPDWQQVEFAYSAPQPRAEGMVLVPMEPTEEQWGGLARDIVMWWCFNKRTGAALFRHLNSCGATIPEWLRKEVDDIDHVPPKGTVAAIIYRAMVEPFAAAPGEGSAAPRVDSQSEGA